WFHCYIEYCYIAFMLLYCYIVSAAHRFAIHCPPAVYRPPYIVRRSCPPFPAFPYLAAMNESKKGGWQLLRQEPGPDLKLFRARYDEMRNPRNGRTSKMIILEAEDSVNVVPLTADGKILFVRQYRFGIGSHTLELPGGIVDPGEGHRQAAERELREETGYAGGQWAYLGKIASNPVFMDNYIHHWVARGVEATAAQQLDEGEEVEVVPLAEEEARRRLLQGEIQHPHAVNALLLFFYKK
ncbi:MAG: NUDIX hydrolase, partial [Phaeodactylibacter sp.]|nr:NUDIX hydrolase [Phaeodactylibacter sp.]